MVRERARRPSLARRRPPVSGLMTSVRPSRVLSSPVRAPPASAYVFVSANYFCTARRRHSTTPHLRACSQRVVAASLGQAPQKIFHRIL